MPRYKAIIEYDGTDFFGFQIQKKQVTVQQVFEKSLNQICGTAIKVVGSGRTDARVHAAAQVVHFDLPKAFEVMKLKEGLSHFLPDKVKVHHIEVVSPDFHARYSAKKRMYVYNFFLGTDCPLYLKPFCEVIRSELDVKRMRQAVKKIIGTHDFTAFCSTMDKSPSKVRKVYRAGFKIKNVEKWPGLSEKTKGKLLHFEIEANGFLHHMVRNIVGTLIEVGKHKIDLTTFQKILTGRDRKKAGKTFAPQGLSLVKVKY